MITKDISIKNIGYTCWDFVVNGVNRTVKQNGNLKIYYLKLGVLLTRQNWGEQDMKVILLR